MKSPPNAIEPFFIAEVLSKGIAEQDLSDKNGHYILKGETYAEIFYLQKVKEGRKSVTYQRPRKPLPILIYLREIFITNIALDENLPMTIDEFQSILTDAL